MFTKILRTVYSANASSTFEKSRKQVTYTGDNERPPESDIKNVLNTLAGKDPDTAPDVAFNVILSKFESSSSKDKWNYIVKNLLILDLTLNDNLFTFEIATSGIAFLQEYKVSKEKLKQKRIDEFIIKYYNYVVTKASILNTPNCPLLMDKHERKDYFSKLNTTEVIEEYQRLTGLLNIGFEVLMTGDQGLLKYNLNQYVFLLILNTMMKSFSALYSGHNIMIKKFFMLSLEDATQEFDNFKQFIMMTENLQTYAKQHSFIPGFQISLNEIRNPAADVILLKSMDDHILSLEKRNKPMPSSINSTPECKDEPVDDGEIPVQEIKSMEVKIETPFRHKSISRLSQPNKNTFDLKILDKYPNLSPKFKLSFEIGFIDIMSIPSTPELNLSPEKYKRRPTMNLTASLKLENIPSEEEYYLQEDTTNDQGENLTPAFSKCLLKEENIEMFDDFNNFYSSEFKGNFEETYANYLSRIGRHTKSVYAFKLYGYVITEFKDPSVGFDEIVKMRDFEERLFDAYENYYSFS